MNPDKTPLVNKLILMTLSLILGCLILLVLRAYEKSPPPQASSIAAVGEPPAEEAVPSESSEVIPPLPSKVRPAPAARSPLAVTKPVPAVPPVVEPVVAEPASPPDVVLNVGGAGGFARNPAAGAVGGGVTGSAFGGISGFAIFRGTPPPEVPIDLGPTCGRLRDDVVTTRHYVVNAEGGLANVLVYAIQEGMRPTVAIPEAVTLDQEGCMFEPYVLALQKEQKLYVRNLDREMHNLHLIPRFNQERNLAQPAGAPPIKFSFDKPELFMRLKCDVHPWMFAYISVLNHPYFAVTDTNGQFQLPAGMPAGRYAVTAKHPKAGGVVQEITLRQGELRSLTFQFSPASPVTPQAQISSRE